MPYERRHVPGEAVDAEEVPQTSTVAVEVTKSAAPLMWKNNGNFDIGQRCPDGSYNFDGKHIVNVTDMTPEQLTQAAKELNREKKREVIEQKELELMLQIANASDTKEEYLDGFYNEPFLNMREVPAGDPLLDASFATIEQIVVQIEAWLNEVRQDMVTKEALRNQLTDLGGPVLEPLTDPFTLSADVDKVKEKVAEIERHLVPSPGPLPVEEDVPVDWLKDVPEVPTVPALPEGFVPDNLLAYFTALHAYQTEMRAYEEAKQFNMGWMLELTRRLFTILETAKAPGTSTESYTENLDKLSRGSLKLAEGNVYSD